MSINMKHNKFYLMFYVWIHGIQNRGGGGGGGGGRGGGSWLDMIGMDDSGFEIS